MNKVATKGESPPHQGQGSYQRWRDRLRSDPAYQAIYDEEASKGDLWLRLVEARLAAGLTQSEVAGKLGVSQAQVARIEKRGYDAYTLKTLRRYVQALGNGFTLEVKVRHAKAPKQENQPTAATV